MDWDELEWQLELLCDEFGIQGDIDDEEFWTGVDMLCAAAIDQGMDEGDVIYALSVAAHNANVNHYVGSRLGFE